MHFGRTAQMLPASFAIGVELACAGSLVMLHVLFGRSPDTRVARVRALVLPPLVGLVVGGGADAAMHYGNHAMSLSLAGVELGGGASELLVIGLLSGSAGLLGALLLVPQILALERARLETEMGTPGSRRGCGAAGRRGLGRRARARGTGMGARPAVRDRRRARARGGERHGCRGAVVAGVADAYVPSRARRRNVGRAVVTPWRTARDAMRPGLLVRR